jgi:proteasome lid subunit RPN8/RPN11
MFGETEIFLSDKAFMSIILSSVEVYKNECHGALLGFQTQGRIIIEYAIPFQSAKRKFAEVMPNWRRELKVIEILPKLIHLQKLGYFHSHPQFGNKRGLPELSEPDKNYMQEGEIEIIVAINDARKTSPWTESKNKLSGTLGNYHIVIAGFYKRKKDSKILQYRVLCPYAIGFDYAFEQ